MRCTCMFAAMTVAACLLLASCGARAPQTPEPGTPEFFWVAAHANFGDSDFEAAHRNLDQLTLSDNPYRRDAAVWLMVISAGLSRAGMDWAAVLRDGAASAGSAQQEFERQAAAARKAADQHAMHLAELVQAFHSAPGTREITLAFVPPELSVDLPPEAARVGRGVLLQAAEAEALRSALERRSMALSLCRLANAGSDMAKARTFLTGEAKLAPAAFEWYLAQEMDAISTLYSPQVMNQPARARLLLGEAATALGAAGDTPEVRQLSKKVAGTLQRLK